MKVNLQKFIASSGRCSRRKAGDLIKEKKVKVNGKVEIITQKELMVINYSPKQPENLIYIKLNKPKGYTCTSRKFKGEKNILDLLTSFPQNTNRLFTAGRLDKNSRGLVLLTNRRPYTKANAPEF